MEQRGREVGAAVEHERRVTQTNDGARLVRVRRQRVLDISEFRVFPSINTPSTLSVSIVPLLTIDLP